jgi:hypothetical protein
VCALCGSCWFAGRWSGHTLLSYNCKHCIHTFATSDLSVCATADTRTVLALDARGAAILGALRALASLALDICIFAAIILWLNMLMKGGELIQLAHRRLCS